MGSRIRSSPSSLLVCWCEVVAGQGPNQPPWIIHKFPNTFSDQQILKSIPQFVFPCTIETTVVQNFSFVLTAVDSTFTFGFCRHSPNSESALVVLSHLPWDCTFYKILNQCSELQSSSSPGDVWSFLQALYTCPIPDPGSELAFTYSQSNKMFVSRCPNHLTLPSIPDNRNLLEYINAVSPDNMMVVFASLLFERRILVSSKHLHRLSACVQAANALLYPMNWQHIYIPVMPEQLLDFLLAPMPFLIGVPEVLMERVRLDEVGEFVHLNADTDTVESPFRDLAELPVDVSGALRRRLNQPAQGMSDSVPRAFLRALVMLIGNYHDALQFNLDQRKVVFNMEKFVASRPSHLQPFVQKMLELQIFRQFLEERLDLVNRGSATSDEFEMEVSVHSDRPRHNYQQLFRAVKKEGGAIVKNFKSKTNPAVKSAVKSVSKGGKQVREQVKEIRDKMRGPNTRVPEQGDWGAEPEHRSAPSSPVSHRRPPSLSSSVTAKASYTRPASTPHRPQRSSQRDRDSSVPPSLSSSSFRSSDSPGRTPTPHTIDLVGELEKELYSRLAEPNSVGPPRAPSFSPTAAPTSRRSSIARPTAVPPAIPRPTALPPPIPNTRSNTTLGTTTTTRESSPFRHALSSTSKDQDLIMLGSPQEEEFDPLLSKSLGCTTLPSRPPCSFDPPDPPTLPRRTSSSSSLSHPHPVPSFLHSNANTARPSPPRSLHPSHDLLHPLPHDASRPSASSSSSSSSISSLHHPYLPFSSSLTDVKSPHNDASSALLGQPLGIPLLPTRTQHSLGSSSDTAINTNSNSISTVNGGSSTAAPLIPVPARRLSNKSCGGVYRSPALSSGGGAVTSSAKVGSGIPASTMAGLPAALQHHLAAKLESPTRSGGSNRGRPFVPSGTTSLTSLTQVDNASSHVQKLQSKTVFDDPRFVPFASLQSTTTAAPTRQANPLYNAHVLPPPATAAGGANVAKPNLAAAFANSMLSGGGSDGIDGDCSRTLLANNNNNNNNNIDPKMLLSDFSEPFAQMKLNRGTPLAGDDSAASDINGGGASKQEVVAAAPGGMGGVNKAGWTAFE